MHNIDINVNVMTPGPEMEMVQKAREALGEGGLKSVRFPQPLESAFDEYYRDKTLKHVRVALLTGFILYAVFGLVDGLLLPADRAHMWFIRYAVVCPTVLVGLAYTYCPPLRRFMQPVVSLVMLVGSLGIVSMVYYDPTPTKNYYYSGLLLLIMGAFTFVSLRLRYAVCWAVATTLAYEAVAIYVNHTDLTILIQNSFSIIATIIIGAFSNSLMENYLRRDFLNTNLLEHENRQLQNATLELRRLSISDPLTGLGNRRHFEVMLDQEWQRAVRSESPIALIFLDIDFFKNFNDNYGHQAGDNCLKLVAQELGRFARRPGDTAARYGGEEFVLLLSGIGLADAATIAKACRNAVEALGIPHSHSPVAGVVTVSAGVAAMIPDLDADRQQLVEAADRALYRAKLKGRNTVVASKRETDQTARQVYPQAVS
ncbi:diguanylate cyclase [Geomonas paludis]|uniref:diguanylate cyclase n=1 Tax=Geomonas paludis TaxID=2740185 RepID=A0A6V8N096_9BACT|nr:diguanylate cyclase [Geomonas paludis]UPU36542.1 diguanylate cyclase [Geomonas paludis]GFO65277.1 GGDEF domain-containing protein [Geomonas paludis]